MPTWPAVMSAEHDQRKRSATCWSSYVVKAFLQIMKGLINIALAIVWVSIFGFILMSSHACRSRSNLGNLRKRNFANDTPISLASFPGATYGKISVGIYESTSKSLDDITRAIHLDLAGGAMKKKNPDIVDEPQVEDELPDQLCLILASMYNCGGAKVPLFLRSVETVAEFALLLKREYVIEDDHGRFMLTPRGILRGAHEAMKGHLNVE